MYESSVIIAYVWTDWGRPWHGPGTCMSFL